MSRGGVEGGDFWQGQTEAVLRGMLHAAALDGRHAADLYRWSLDPVAAREAVTILGRESTAALGWDGALDGAATADPRTRDSIWLGVRQALGALADPRVLDAVTPTEGRHFDPTSFLEANGTLYLLGTASGAAAASALVTAFVEDVLETARRLAAASPRSRLDPPLLLALDEIGNLAPLPSLPTLMSEGGGTGITTLAVLQSLAQARDRWGQQAAGTIWDAAIVKIILGGGSNARDLADLASLIGERDEDTRIDKPGRLRWPVDLHGETARPDHGHRDPADVAVRHGRASAPDRPADPAVPSRLAGAEGCRGPRAGPRDRRAAHPRARDRPMSPVGRTRVMDARHAAYRLRYERFMASSRWRTRRREWLREHLRRIGTAPICACCGHAWTLHGDLHHLTYDRLGHERHEDLLPLCRTCHTVLHRILDGSPHWRAMPRATASLMIIERLAADSQPNHSLQ